MDHLGQSFTFDKIDGFNILEATWTKNNLNFNVNFSNINSNSISQSQSSLSLIATRYIIANMYVKFVPNSYAVSHLLELTT